MRNFNVCENKRNSSRNSSRENFPPVIYEYQYIVNEHLSAAFSKNEKFFLTKFSTMYQLSQYNKEFIHFNLNTGTMKKMR